MRGFVMRMWPLLSGILTRLGAVARRAATVALALPLLYMVLTIASAVAGAVAMIAVTAVLRLYTPNLAWDLIVVAVASSLAGVYGAVPLTRFSLRVFPLRADRARRWGLICAMLLTAISVSGIMLWRLIHPLAVPAYTARVESVLTGLIVATLQLLVLLQVYGTRDAGMSGPQVLYLRRFRSFSDRVVYRVLLRALPSGSCVTALVSAHGGARDLDPFTVAFDGQRLLHPLASIPRTFVSPDEEWQTQVRTRMGAAQCIVVDGSADSASMQYEYGLIRSLGLGARTIVLVDEKQASDPPEFQGSAVVRYRRTRWPSVSRVLVWLGLVLLYAALSLAHPLTYPMVGLPFFLLAVPALLQRSVRGEAVLHLRTAIRLRVSDSPQLRTARLLREAVVLGLGLATVLLGVALASIGWFRPLPSSVPAAWEAMSLPMAPATIRVGAQEIRIPVPAGFADPRDLHPNLRAVLQTEEARGLQVLSFQLPLDQIARMVFDPSRPFDERLVVFTPVEALNESIDVETFAFAVEYFEQRAGDKLPPGSYGPVPIAAGNRFWLQFFTRPMQVIVDGRSIAITKACAIAYALAHGKMVGLNLCRDERTERDAEWVRVLGRAWVDEVLRLNPATPPLARGKLGFELTAGYSFRFSELRLSRQLTVREVVIGSAAAEAGLQPGDEIIEVGSLSVAADLPGATRALSKLPEGGRLALTLRRGGDTIVVELYRR